MFRTKEYLFENTKKKKKKKKKKGIIKQNILHF